MNFEIEITDRISEEQHSLESLIIEKMSAQSICMERHFLLEMEKKRSLYKRYERSFKYNAKENRLICLELETK